MTSATIRVRGWEASSATRVAAVAAPDQTDGADPAAYGADTIGTVHNCDKDVLGAVYIGPLGLDTPVNAADRVIAVFAVDRRLFDETNAAKMKTHLLHSGDNNQRGSLERGDMGGSAVEGGMMDLVEQYLCVVPWTGLVFMSMLCITGIYPQSGSLLDSLSRKHSNMAWPMWADKALVLTEKGVVGRRYFGPDRPTTHGDRDVNEGVNAISWDGLDVDQVRIRTFDAPACMTKWPSRGPPADPRFERDPLVVGFFCGLGTACCKRHCTQPDVPGLYRATIQSTHESRDNSGSGDAGPIIWHTASIDLLALAKSPDVLLNTLREAKAKYGAPTAATMER